MIKKRYVIVALAIVSILLGSFLVNSVILAQTGGEYDPWLDFNGDGTIDVNDLSPLGQSYGSSGDSTKNVSVTNWPGPQKPTFADILVLRGLAYEFYKTSREVAPGKIEWVFPKVLVDEDMPCPPKEVISNFTYLYVSDFVPLVWERGTDQNFTFVPANTPFFIQGDVIIRPTLHHEFSGSMEDDVFWNITVHLEKVNPETTIVLASDTISMSRHISFTLSQTLNNHAVILNFPSPVLVETGERLQIRFETWARSNLGYISLAYIYVWHELGTDEFIAYIPTLQP